MDYVAFRRWTLYGEKGLVGRKMPCSLFPLEVSRWNKAARRLQLRGTGERIDRTLAGAGSALAL